MSHALPEIDAALAAWLVAQPVFFVASAPLAGDGHVNCSPKGGDAFRVLDAHTVAYLDYTGSGAETIAHLRENGRLVLMFCAFTGPPKIVRLHGRGTVVLPDDPRYAALAAQFPGNPGARSVIHLAVTRVSTSCGYAVPFMDFRAPRPALDQWATKQGPEKLVAYRDKKNQSSLDGLPALGPPGLL